MSKIDELLREVEKLRDEHQTPTRDAEFQHMEHAMCAAKMEASVLRKERDELRADIEKLRRDVARTMDKLRIADLFRLRGSETVPCAEEGWLPLSYDPEDTKRIEWLNEHGRASASPDSWLVAFPHRLTMSENLPTPYNVRHLIDLSRGISLGGGGAEQEANNGTCETQSGAGSQSEKADRL